MHSLFLLLLLDLVNAYSPAPRWGSASALIHNTLFVQGGKTDASNGYNAGTNVNDLLVLDLSSSFDLSNPPWQYISNSNASNSDGPAVAFHTLSPFSATSILLFGGNGGPAQALPGGNDSGWILDITNITQPTWSQLPSSVEPARVDDQAAVSVNGSVYIIGGEKTDGSGPATSSYQYASTQFVGLPTTSAPTGLFGHAAVALSNGTILVFGGTLSSGMQSMNTIYALDTTTSPPTWSVSQTQGPTPSARRNFAAVALADDTVFVQGGAGDSSVPPQSFLSDGFVLDTSTNPMTWSAVNEVGQLGARAAHSVITQEDQILFAFGWTTGGTAISSVSVFNTTSKSFATSWIPVQDSATPSSTADGTSNLFPSATAPISSTPSATVSPNPSQSTSPNPNSNINSHSLAIALAVVFGVLSLIAVAGGSTYIAIKRREERNGGAFQLMEEEKNVGGGGVGGAVGEQTSPHTYSAPEKVHLVGSRAVPPTATPWGFLSGALGGAKKSKNRVDMLADEDQSEYDVNAFHAIPGHRPPGPTRGASGHSFGSSISNWYGGAAGSRRNWTGWVGQSFNSIKSVSGAMVARRDATADSVAVESEIPWWDRDAVPLDPFGDDMALREQPEIGATTLASNNVSGIAAVGVGLAARPRGGLHTSSSSYPYSDPTELGEHIESSVRLVDPSGSHSAVASTSAHPLQGGTTPQSLSSNDHSSSDPSSDPSTSSNAATPTGLHTTSIIGTSGSGGAPIRRSDSWWARLSKPARLERHMSPPTSPRQSAGDTLLDFRDPQPAPKLVPIKEGSGGSSASAAAEGSQSDPSRRRSIASMETTKTADSDGLAGMFAMDVVQRQGTASSHGTSSSAEDIADDTHSGSGASRDTNVLVSDIIQSPIDAPLVPPSLKTTNSSSSGELSLAGSSVADRVQGWERRQSQDSPQPYRRERRSTYGLAPRSSKFITNPDEDPAPAPDP